MGNKIFHATGIMPHRLDILNVQISTKRVKLAWVKFEKIRTVNDIFCLAVLNGNMTKFNAFPHIPGKAMARKEGLKKILKNLQIANKQIRYQIRLGSKDLEVMIKIHQDFDYKPYRKIDIESLDPNGDVPNWDLVTADEKKNEKHSNPSAAGKNAGKKEASSSPEGHRSKRVHIDEWQVQEFVWAFLEGTATTPKYTNLTWELEENEEEMENENYGETEKDKDQEIEAEDSQSEGEVDEE